LAVKRDISFFEDHLVALLFMRAVLNNNFRLNEFFSARDCAVSGQIRHPFKDAVSPEQLGRLVTRANFLTLRGRRVALGEDVARDRGSLEFHLQRIDPFTKLGSQEPPFNGALFDVVGLPCARQVLGDGAQFRSHGRMGEIQGAFKNARYFRLSQRSDRGVSFLRVDHRLFYVLAIYVR